MLLVHGLSLDGMKVGLDAYLFKHNLTKIKEVEVIYFTILPSQLEKHFHTKW